MPIYQEWSPSQHSLAAIWHIEEPEAFFQDRTGISPQIKHPRKRIEHLCGRYLLQHLKRDFPLHNIAPDAHDKPRLPENRYFFSISHSHPYVAAIISDKEECGMDIQVWKDGIKGIAHMFLSDEEQALCSDSASSGGVRGEAALLTLAWTAKEAAYKWWGRRGADFIRDLPIERIAAETSAYYPPQLPEPYRIQMSCFNHSITHNAVLYKDFALSCISAPRPKNTNDYLV